MDGGVGGGERGVGQQPWKIRRSDPLRARYVIRRADRYNPLNRILGKKKKKTQLGLGAVEAEQSRRWELITFAPKQR